MSPHALTSQMTPSGIVPVFLAVAEWRAGSIIAGATLPACPMYFSRLLAVYKFNAQIILEGMNIALLGFQDQCSLFSLLTWIYQ